MNNHTTSDIVIRPGIDNDFPAIDAFDPFAGDRQSEISEDRCLVATRDHQIVGYLSYKQDGFICRPFICFMAVHPDHQRNGIATQLLQTAQQIIGSGRLFISTGENNLTMQALLKRHGWISAGCVKAVNNDDTAELFYYRDL